MVARASKRHAPACRSPIDRPARPARGDLDKAIIRRYIKRNVDKIAYCYEKQLLANPGIEGTSRSQFFITPTGTVTSSTGGASTTTVANCVADVIGAIEFPQAGVAVASR